jgi:hypothetical protein
MDIRLRKPEITDQLQSSCELYRKIRGNFLAFGTDAESSFSGNFWSSDAKSTM